MDRGAIPSTQDSHEFQEPLADGAPFSVGNLPAGALFEIRARGSLKPALRVVAIRARLHSGSEGKRDCLFANEPALLDAQGRGRLDAAQVLFGLPYFGFGPDWGFQRRNRRNLDYILADTHVPDDVGDPSEYRIRLRPIQVLIWIVTRGVTSLGLGALRENCCRSVPAAPEVTAASLYRQL